MKHLLRFLTFAAVSHAVSAYAAITFTSDLTSLGPNLQITNTVDAAKLVAFSGSGATFTGAGDPGRNYIRTVDADYDTGSFIAEVTWNGVGGTAFMGLGGGNIGEFGTPDWDVADSLWFEKATGASSPGIQGVAPTGRFSSAIVTFGSAIDTGDPVQPVRFRMALDMTAGTLQFFADNAYAGGPFVADASTPLITLASVTNAPPNFLQSAQGDEVRFYFGGNGGTFSNFSVEAIPEPATAMLASIAALGLAVTRRRKA